MLTIGLSKVMAHSDLDSTSGPSSYKLVNNHLYNKDPNHPKKEQYHPNKDHLNKDPNHPKKDSNHPKKGLKPSKQGPKPSEKGLKPSEQGPKSSEKGPKPSEKGPKSSEAGKGSNHIDVNVAATKVTNHLVVEAEPLDETKKKDYISGGDGGASLLYTFTTSTATTTRATYLPSAAEEDENPGTRPSRNIMVTTMAEEEDKNPGTSPSKKPMLTRTASANIYSIYQSAIGRRRRRNDKGRSQRAAWNFLPLQEEKKGKERKRDEKD